PGAGYWTDRQPDAAVLTQVRAHLATLARHAQASAGRAPSAAQRSQGYRDAARYLQQSLDWFPDDAGAAQTTLQLADALLEAGDTGAAARQYGRSAYDYPPHAQ